MESTSSPPLYSLKCNNCDKPLGKIDNQTEIVVCKDCYDSANDWYGDD